MLQTYRISAFRHTFLMGMLLLLWLLPMNELCAQPVAGVEEKGILYTKVSHAGLMLHSSGLGIDYRRGKHLTGYSYLLGDFALLTMKHPKEVKSVNSFSDNNSGYFYGKLNSLVIARTGIGKQKTINPKGDKGGVEVSYAYYGGASWGFAKPVYLTVFKFDDLNGVSETIERYDPAKHFPDNISGRASWFRGFSQSHIYPGIYGSFLLNFELGRDQERLEMIETGVTLDLFANKVPIMALNTNSNYFFTFFLRVVVGKQWY